MVSTGLRRHLWKQLVDDNEEEDGFQANKATSIGVSKPEVPEDELEKGQKPKLRRSKLAVAGLCCPSETPIISRICKALPGVQDISIEIANKTVTVTHDECMSTAADLVAALNEAALDAREVKRKTLPRPRQLPKRLFLAAILWILSLVCAALEWEDLWRVTALLCIAVTVVKVGLRAVNSLRRCVPDMNVLVILACLGAVSSQSYSEAATVLFLFSLAEYMESGVTNQARAAIQEVLALCPDEAELVSGENVAVQDVPVGAIVVVRQGDQVPVDGRVVAGAAVLDESTLSGESKPVEKGLGDPVSAGTTSISGYIQVETTSLTQDSSIAKLVQLIENSQGLRSSTEKSVEKFARIYTPCILATAMITMIVPWLVNPFVGGQHFYNTLVLLVIACPCALVISTPITYLSGIACCATHGILVRGGMHLETLGDTKVVAMDKTGTITQGSFRLRAFRCREDIDEMKVWRWIAAIEARSSHPVAAALTAAAYGRGVRAAVDVKDYSEIEGEGVQATVEGVRLAIGNERLAQRMGWSLECSEMQEWASSGGTVLWIGSTEGLIARCSVCDAPREEAKRVISSMLDAGIQLKMLTGDMKTTADAVANLVGITDVRAGLLPDDKISHIMESTRHCSHAVAMVGDGVNDVPALAAASVGIAMGAAGRASALEMADVVLMDSDLEKLVLAFRLGKRVLQKIRQNIAFAIISKLVLVLITLSGYGTLWGAIVADVGAMLVVTLNGVSVMSLRRAWKRQIAPPPMPLASTCTDSCCRPPAAPAATVLGREPEVAPPPVHIETDGLGSFVPSPAPARGSFCGEFGKPTVRRQKRPSRREREREVAPSPVPVETDRLDSSPPPPAGGNFLGDSGISSAQWLRQPFGTEVELEIAPPPVPIEIDGLDSCPPPPVPAGGDFCRDFYTSSTQRPRRARQGMDRRGQLDSEERERVPQIAAL
eukprot:TRINITY_DN2236_c0_g2_i1.p1 TRINITY_DN2236_c0_g2~~TRINITY_DN2236_c0_g2_i1.p1  ORF type:complete len:946 (-),score=191.37 TRINITY_DN2236_c0_g2_i1:574-3411(-)